MGRLISDTIDIAPFLLIAQATFAFILIVGYIVTLLYMLILYFENPDFLAGKFVPFKTPLDEKYDSQVPEANRFNIPMLIASLKTYKVKFTITDDTRKLKSR